MTTFTSKTVYELYSLEFGILEVPFQGIENEQPEVKFHDDFKLEVLYLALTEEGPVTVKAHYTCPVIQFLKDSDIFSADDNNPMDCQWQLTGHEIIPSEECSKKSFLVKVITYNSVDLVVVKAASASKARFAAVSVFADGEISASGEHVFTDTTGYTFVADSVREVAEQDLEVLKNYL